MKKAKIAISLQCPEILMQLVETSTLKGKTNVDKLNVLIDHFVTHSPPLVDMSFIPRPRNKDIRQFTFRISPESQSKLDEYCSKTLYTRHQAIQIAIPSALNDLGVIVDNPGVEIKRLERP